jgi:hypothetical protein
MERFACFSGCSIDVTDNAKAIARASETAFTAERGKETQYATGKIKRGETEVMKIAFDPTVIKPVGSQPTVIAEAKDGKGKILAWGDLSLWEAGAPQQGGAPMGELFSDPSMEGRKLALNMMSYLSTPLKI